MRAYNFHIDTFLSVFLTALIGYTSNVLGSNMHESTLKFIQSLEVKNAQVLRSTPSLLLTDYNDRRISQYANTTNECFVVITESDTDSYTIIVDPKQWSGFLWWRRPVSLAFKSKRYLEIIKGSENLNQAELDTLSTFR